MPIFSIDVRWLPKSTSSFYSSRHCDNVEDDDGDTDSDDDDDDVDDDTNERMD